MATSPIQAPELGNAIVPLDKDGLVMSGRIRFFPTMSEAVEAAKTMAKKENCKVMVLECANMFGPVIKVDALWSRRG